MKYNYIICVIFWLSARHMLGWVVDDNNNNNCNKNNDNDYNNNDDYNINVIRL